MAIKDIPRAPLIALGVFLLMAVPSFAEFYTDWLRTPTPALLPVFDRLGEAIGRFMAEHGAAAGPA